MAKNDHTQRSHERKDPDNFNVNYRPRIDGAKGIYARAYAARVNKEMLRRQLEASLKAS
jgi:hypothetical protein